VNEPDEYEYLVTVQGSDDSLKASTGHIVRLPREVTGEVQDHLERSQRRHNKIAGAVHGGISVGMTKQNGEHVPLRILSTDS